MISFFVLDKLFAKGTSFRTRASACAAILLLQMNLGLGAETPVSGPENSSPARPEAPVPTAAAAAIPQPTLAQQAQQAQQQPVAPPKPFYVEMPHSRNPLSPYMPSNVPELDLTNSPRLQNLIREGKLYISLRDAIALAIENNLDLASFRYNFPIAETDIQRTKAGSTAQGVDTSVVQASAQGGFSGGASAGGGGSSGGSAAAGAGGIVTSTLGSGTLVSSFDPFLSFKALVDHSITQEPNAFQNGGVPIYKQNTIQALANFTQNFPTGTGMQIFYQGQRQASNSHYNSINPELNATFELYLSQQLLAGFGLATNTRYIQIAKKNMQITDQAFRAQVIASVTQVENIYWDLVSAYQDEQIKERLLSFAQKTLSDDQHQLELNAIPAMQVTKDQSDVATSEGDLTVARATLRLNELLMKNAVTKTDDPTIDEMPVIPLDTKGADDPNAGKSISDLIAEAEKNNPQVVMNQMAMENKEASLKSIRSELLPQLFVYGFYAGNGFAGPQNADCTLGPAECSSTLPVGFTDMFVNTFNYSSPEYQFGMNLQINLRNRQAKADQFRAVLEFRRSQIAYEEQKKNIRFDVRNSQFALQQAQARVVAAQKARDLAQHTFDITEQEQKLGAKSSYDTLVAQHDLGVAESALVAAEGLYEKAKVQLDQSTGTTLELTGVSIDDAKSGVVTRAP